MYLVLDCTASLDDDRSRGGDLLAPYNPPAVSAGSSVRTLTGMMRLPLVISAGVLLALGLDLAIFTTSTHRFFSWTIEPPLTAAVFSSFYLSAFLILVIALRGGIWARVKPVLPGGILFSVLAVVATFLHLDRFHMNSPDVVARSMFWIWLVAYLILPPALLAAVPSQLRAPGEDAASPRSPSAVNYFLTGLGAVMAVLGAIFFVSPLGLAGVWPWTLTPLTGRVLGAWLIGLGLVFAVTGRGGYRGTTAASFAGLSAFGILQVISLIRFYSDFEWTRPSAWVVLTFLTIALAVGAAGLMVQSGAREEVVQR
ncbi:MAG: hypothetical protein ACRDI1_06655 [Actinomycetota bacterium]